jgi:hypothetical protein
MGDQKRSGFSKIVGAFGIVIVRACAGILVGVVIIFIALWRVANYTWDSR